MIKKGKNILSGFTLIEVLVVISIIAVMAIGISNINWNTLTDKQKSTILKNRVVSELETIRNNALFGKGVTASLFVPEQWIIHIFNDQIDISYLSGSTNINYKNIAITPPERIRYIYCGDDNTVTVSSPAELVFRGSEVSFGVGTCDGQNILSLDLDYKQNDEFIESIEINAVSGLIGDK